MPSYQSLISVPNRKLTRSSLYIAANIENLEQTGETATSISLAWEMDVTTTDGAPLKYSLTINDFITQEFLCSMASCTYEVMGLEGCSVYDLDLIAVFDTADSDTASIEGNTAYESKSN